MKRISQMVTTLLVLGLGIVLFAQSQSRVHSYDPKTEVKVKGTIQDVEEQAPRRGWKSTHLILKTDSATLPVLAGPSVYITNKQFSFAKGDEIEVLGSKLSVDGKDVLLAREITKGGKTLVLRNAQGVPEWARARGR
jgi:hypothetical protein